MMLRLIALSLLAAPASGLSLSLASHEIPGSFSACCHGYQANDNQANASGAFAPAITQAEVSASSFTTRTRTLALLLARPKAPITLARTEPQPFPAQP